MCQMSLKLGKGLNISTSGELKMSILHTMVDFNDN